MGADVVWAEKANCHETKVGDYEVIVATIGETSKSVDALIYQSLPGGLRVAINFGRVDLETAKACVLALARALAGG